MKALNLEVMLNEDKSVSSMAHMIKSKINEKKVIDICGHGLSLKKKQCFDLLMILIKSQSNIAQTLLMNALKTETTIEGKNEILKLLVQIPNPQNSLINHLIDIMMSQKDDNYEGILLLSISNLGYHSKSNEIKNKIANILKEKLSQKSCNSDVLDILEAMGNLGHNSNYLKGCFLTGGVLGVGAVIMLGTLFGLIALAFGLVLRFDPEARHTPGNDGHP